MGVVLTTAVLCLMIGTFAGAWVVTPLGVAGLLVLSLGRALRSARSAAAADAWFVLSRVATIRRLSPFNRNRTCRP